MDVLTILVTILRRWYVVVPVLALTAGAVMLVIERAEPEYELRGSFLISTEAFAGVDPELSEPDTDRDVGVPVGISSTLIAEAVQSGDVHARLEEQGGTASYEVVAEGDLLRVTATDTDRDTVVPTVLGVLDVIEEEVERRQGTAVTGEGSRVLVEVLAVPNEASVREQELEGEEPGGGYVASGSVRLLSTTDQEAMNPYANAPFSLRILEEYLHGEEGFRRVVESVHVSGEGDVDDLADYVIEAQTRDVAPIVYIAATGTDPGTVEHTFRAIVDVGSAELVARQERLGLVSPQVVSLQELAVPSSPQRLESDLQRPVITVVGLGLAAAAGLALFVDSLIHGRARRRNSQEVALESDGVRDTEATVTESRAPALPEVAIGPDASTRPEVGNESHARVNGNHVAAQLSDGSWWLAEQPATSRTARETSERP